MGFTHINLYYLFHKIYNYYFLFKFFLYYYEISLFISNNASYLNIYFVWYLYSSASFLLVSVCIIGLFSNVLLSVFLYIYIFIKYTIHLYLYLYWLLYFTYIFIYSTFKCSKVSIFISGFLHLPKSSLILSAF